MAELTELTEWLKPLVHGECVGMWGVAQAAGWGVLGCGVHAPHDDRRLAQVAQVAQMVFDLK